MKDSKRVFIRMAVPSLFAAALAMPVTARSAASDEEIANGLDAVTLGQAVGHYAGGAPLSGEYCPMAPESVAQAADEDIANGLDPITLGRAIGNYAGGALLEGEYLPGGSRVLTAEGRQQR